MSSSLHVPTKTPPLTFRLYWNGPRPIFHADSFEAFQRSYAEALAATSEATGVSVAAYRTGRGNRHRPIKRIGIGGHDGDDRFFTVSQRLSANASAINEALDVPSARISGFPEYDLHLAVAQAGSPLAWACTDAALYLMCQKEYLWGRRLGRFIDGTVEGVFDEIAETRERETGNYEPRIVKRRQRN